MAGLMLGASLGLCDLTGLDLYPTLLWEWMTTVFLSLSPAMSNVPCSHPIDLRPVVPSLSEYPPLGLAVAEERRPRVVAGEPLAEEPLTGPLPSASEA